MVIDNIIDGNFSSDEAIRGIKDVFDEEKLKELLLSYHQGELVFYACLFKISFSG